MSGHAGDGVVYDNNVGNSLVVCNIHKTCNAGMHECGVADNGYTLVSLAANLGKAVKCGNGCAHAKRGVHACKRCRRAESVASNIAAYVQTTLFEEVENASVGTSGAKHRRSYGDIVFKRVALILFAKKKLGNKLLRELSADGEYIFTVALDSHSLDVCFNDGIKLFYNDNTLVLCREV